MIGINYARSLPACLLFTPFRTSNRPLSGIVHFPSRTNHPSSGNVHFLSGKKRRSFKIESFCFITNRPLSGNDYFLPGKNRPSNGADYFFTNTNRPLSGNKNFPSRTNHPSLRNKYFLIGKKYSLYPWFPTPSYLILACPKSASNPLLTM